MKKEGKNKYETPAITVIEVKIEGIVCQSRVNAGNSINNWEDGDTSNEELYM